MKSRELEYIILVRDNGLLIRFNHRVIFRIICWLVGRIKSPETTKVIQGRSRKLGMGNNFLIFSRYPM